MNYNVLSFVLYPRRLYRVSFSELTGYLLNGQAPYVILYSGSDHSMSIDLIHGPIKWLNCGFISRTKLFLTAYEVLKLCVMHVPTETFHQTRYLIPSFTHTSNTDHERYCRIETFFTFLHKLSNVSFSSASAFSLSMYIGSYRSRGSRGQKII